MAGATERSSSPRLLMRARHKRRALRGSTTTRLADLHDCRLLAGWAKPRPRPEALIGAGGLEPRNTYDNRHWCASKGAYFLAAASQAHSSMSLAGGAAQGS